MCQQNHTFETITPFVAEIKARFPTMGARQLVTTLRQDYQLKVPEYVLHHLLPLNVYPYFGRKMVLDHLNLMEQEAIKFCKQKHFRRKQFWAVGVNDIWTCNQHDKWKQFGLWFHLGLDPFPGQLQWFKVWWTNRNPQLVGSYYLEAGQKHEGAKMIRITLRH